jgi:hypothetical protein
MQVHGKLIVRVMRKYDLFRRIKQQFTRPADLSRCIPNVLKGREVTAKNQVWADITCLSILAG